MKDVYGYGQGENGYVIYNWDTESFVCDVRSRMWDIGIDGTPRYVFCRQAKEYLVCHRQERCYCYRPGEKNAVSCLSVRKGDTRKVSL